VQLYTRDLVSSVTTYEKNLRGFERIGCCRRTKTVKFVLRPDALPVGSQHALCGRTWKVQSNDRLGSEDIRLHAEFEIVGRRSQLLALFVSDQPAH